jgi:hypothetical protein
MISIERRKNKRYDILEKVRIRYGNKVLAGTAINISIGGICIHTTRNLKAYTKASLGIRIPEEVVFYGDVIWSEEVTTADGPGFKIGFSIQMLSLDDAIQTDESKTNEIIQTMVNRYSAKVEFEEFPDMVT